MLKNQKICVHKVNQALTNIYAKDYALSDPRVLPILYILNTCKCKKTCLKYQNNIKAALSPMRFSYLS